MIGDFDREWIIATAARWSLEDFSNFIKGLRTASAPTASVRTSPRTLSGSTLIGRSCFKI